LYSSEDTSGWDGGKVVPLEDVQELIDSMDELMTALNHPFGYLIHCLIPAITRAQNARKERP
jgi:hypothetical protein